MRAAIVDRYGPAESVRVAEVPRPEPRADEVLVRVSSAAVTSGDARIRGGRFPAGFGPVVRAAFGWRGPRRRVLGSSFSGTVEARGDGVSEFAVGDAVCGMTGTRFGTHAEYVAVPIARIVAVPGGVVHDDAAAVLFGGTTALHFLRDKAAVHAGQSVLVIGASGAVGTNAVQIAADLGATVTGVTSGPNAALVEQLGAVRVIDHTRERVDSIAERFDVVIDTVGVLSILSGRRLLNERGKLLLIVADLATTLRARGDVIAGSSRERPHDFVTLLALVAEGKLKVVHDSAFALDDIAEAYRRVDSGHKVGNVIVNP